MNQSPNESHIRDLLQRVKQADEEATPAFDEVLNRDARPATRTSSRQMAIAFVCVAASVFFVAFVWQSVVRNKSVDPVRQVVEGDGPILSIDASESNDSNQVDFDYLNQLVDDRFAAMNAGNDSTPTNFGMIRIWSSETESLLALTYNENLNSE